MFVISYVACVDIDIGIDLIRHTSITIMNSSMMMIDITTPVISPFLMSSTSTSTSTSTCTRIRQRQRQH